MVISAEVQASSNRSPTVLAGVLENCGGPSIGKAGADGEEHSADVASGKTVLVKDNPLLRKPFKAIDHGLLQCHHFCGTLTPRGNTIVTFSAMQISHSRCDGTDFKSSLGDLFWRWVNRSWE